MPSLEPPNLSFFAVDVTAGLRSSVGSRSASNPSLGVASTIPKKVYVTDKDDPHLEDNPNWDGFEIVYFDDEALEQSMKNLSHFLERELGVQHAYRAYDELVPMAYKVDLWRYCILWAEGGTCECSLERRKGTE